MLLALLSLVLAAQTPETTTFEATDPAAGLLVEVVEPGLDCSSGMVLAPATPDGEIKVRELHNGKLEDSELKVRDQAVLPALSTGQRVLVYRSAEGVELLPAS
jgi:hypothetical protein